MRASGHPLTKNATTRAKHAILRHAFAQAGRTHTHAAHKNRVKQQSTLVFRYYHTAATYFTISHLATHTAIAAKGIHCYFTSLYLSDDEKDSIHCYCYDFSRLYNQALPPSQSPPRCHHGIATTNSNFFTLLLSAFFIPFV